MFPPTEKKSSFLNVNPSTNTTYSLIDVTDGNCTGTISGTAPIIVIAEGAIPQDGDMITKDQPLDAFGHVQLSGIGDWLAKEIETKTGHQTRCTVLGHIQRGGTPSAFDRVLSSRFGLEAITAVHEGDFGKMMALHGTKIARVPLASATDVLKTVPIERYEEITSFFG